MTPIGTLQETSGPAWNLYTAVCPKCGKSIGVAQPVGQVWPKEPLAIAWDAIHGPGAGDEGVGFVPHKCSPKLKAYHINDCDTYAGVDLEDAIAAAMEDSGLTREEILDTDVTDTPHEADPSERVRNSDQGGWTTVGEILESMDRRGLVSTSEW
jgi:hypothetical protein